MKCPACQDGEVKRRKFCSLHCYWESLKGNKLSEETKEKMSIAHKKNPVRYWLGKKQSEESQKKRSDSLKKVEHTWGWKAGLANLGKKIPSNSG